MSTRVTIPAPVVGALLGTEWEDRLHRHSNPLLGDWFEAEVDETELVQLRLDLAGALEQVEEAEWLATDPGEQETMANLAQSVRWAIHLLPVSSTN